MLATGLAICMTLVAVANELALNQSQGIEQTRTSTLGYHLRAMEREFPLALNHTVLSSFTYMGAGELSIHEFFKEAAAPFQTSLARQGIICSITLDDISQISSSSYLLSWSYTLSNDRSQISVGANMTLGLTAIDPWWSEDWPYRYGLLVDIPNPERRASLAVTVNFSRELDRFGVVDRFDTASLRVVAQSNLTGDHEEVPAGFFPAPEFNSWTNAIGDVLWSNIPDYTHYYIYYDVTHKVEPERTMARTGSLRVNTTGWVENDRFNYQWEMANNSYLRIFSYQGIEPGAGGWLIGGVPANWTELTIQENTNGALRLELRHGALTRQVTIWSDSPVMMWQDIQGATDDPNGINIKAFPNQFNGSRDGYNYTVSHRNGAYLSMLVPTGDSLTAPSVGGVTTMASNSTTGYLILGHQGSLAGTEVTEHLVNLVSLKIKTMGNQKLNQDR